MRSFGILAAVLLGIWLSIAAPAAAQAGTVSILDPDGLLGSEAASVNEAAQRLAATGADVIVLAGGPSAGTDEQAARQFLNQLLVNNGIAPSVDELQPNQILLYVARDAQITGILFGTRWRETLDPVWRNIMNEQMNPAFSRGDIPGGLVAGIDELRTTISPPPPNRTPLYVLGATLLVAAILFATFPLIRRRREAATAVAGANRRLEQARREAGAALADLGQLVQAAEDKAQFDRVSYSAADIERLNELQSRGIGSFRDAQAAFDEAEEQRATNAPTITADIEALAGRYRGVQEQVKASIGPIREAEQLRSELDARGIAQTGATVRLEDGELGVGGQGSGAGGQDSSEP